MSQTSGRAADRYENDRNDVVAANIARSRIAQKMTQAELGRALGGWPRQAVSAMEHGKREITVRLLHELANVLMRSPEWLLEDHGGYCPTCGHDVHLAVTTTPRHNGEPPRRPNTSRGERM